MQNLKIFIALVSTIFLMQTTAQAQCFHMTVNPEYLQPIFGMDATVLEITIDNYGGGTVIVSDSNYGKVKTISSSGLHTFRWVYFTPYEDTIELMPGAKIDCKSIGSCIQYEGCTILIDPR